MIHRSWVSILAFSKRHRYASISIYCTLHLCVFFQAFASLVDLIKRPCVPEAAIPDLIHYLRCMHIILARWSLRD